MRFKNKVWHGSCLTSSIVTINTYRVLGFFWGGCLLIYMCFFPINLIKRHC
jgi:hypothetical protein